MMQEVGRYLLDWFRVTLAVDGLTEAEVKPDLAYLQMELEARIYLRNPQTRWDSKLSHIIVTIEAQNLDVRSAGLTLYDELFESVAATINFKSEAGFSIRILDVQSVQ